MSNKINTLLVGAYIRGLRDGKGESQMELSRSTGITQSTLSRVEKGTTVPSIIIADKILNHYGLGLLALVDFMKVTKTEYESFEKSREYVIDIFSQHSNAIALFKELIDNNPALTLDQRSKMQRIIGNQ